MIKRSDPSNCWIGTPPLSFRHFEQNLPGAFTGSLNPQEIKKEIRQNIVNKYIT